MYKSIQHFASYGIKNIQENVKNEINNKSDIGKISKIIQSDLNELGRNLIKELLEDIDKELREIEERKNDYQIVHRDSTNSFHTKMGLVEYKRTYFKNKITGEREYLLDNMFGIKEHENIASDVEEVLINEATQTTYRKSGELAINTEIDLSKQTTMNYVAKYDFKFPEIVTGKEEKKKCKLLYIEADEDHVKLQNGKKAEPRLIYIHEGIKEKSIGTKRKQLESPTFFASLGESSENFWDRVLTWIEHNYDYDVIDKIFISGDGAAWIKAGVKYITKSEFVLDKFHLHKYITRATAHVSKNTYFQLTQALYGDDIGEATRIHQYLIENTDVNEKARIDRINKAFTYFYNNWSGITIYERERGRIVGCSAEGHISHIFSNRFSSRPKGWCIKNLSILSNLIVYKLNGGDIVDLVSKRREYVTEETKPKKKNTNKKKIYTKAQNEYYRNTPLPIITMGENTLMCKYLKNVRSA